MVFLRVRRKRNMEVSTDLLDSGDEILRKRAFHHLFDMLTRAKATAKTGYFVAVSEVDAIGEGKFDDATGKVVFPLKYTFITVLPFKGEILVGKADAITRLGLIVKCGPIDAFVSERMMNGYKFKTINNKVMYMHENLLVNRPLRILKGDKVRVRVYEIIWHDASKEFQVYATIDGDFLGPIRKFFCV